MHFNAVGLAIGAKIQTSLVLKNIPNLNIEQGTPIFELLLFIKTKNRNSSFVNRCSIFKYTPNLTNLQISIL